MPTSPAGVYGYSFVDGQALEANCEEKFMVDHAHGVLRESALNLEKGRMIGAVSSRESPRNSFERGPVVDLGFQLRVGIDLKPC